jgi:hypothetical protein
MDPPAGALTAAQSGSQVNADRVLPVSHVTVGLDAVKLVLHTGVQFAPK